VWQWCANKYSDNSTSRVLRGGSWLSSPVNCRAAYRNYYEPGDRSSLIGFRVVLD